MTSKSYVGSIIAFIATAYFICVATWIVIRSEKTVDSGCITHIKRLGGIIVYELDDHYSRTGSYPSSLGAAGIENAETGLGTYKYNVSYDRQSFRLSIGQILRDGFSLIYTSEHGWYFDS